MYDCALKNGTIVDGSRKKPFVGNLYISDGKIAEISTEEREAARVCDVSGLTVAPGFVDIHSHSDASFLTVPTYEGKLRGGVTFELVGQCGISMVPLTPESREDTMRTIERSLDQKVSESVFSATDYAGYARAVTETGISINQGGLVGHGALRACIIGWQMRQLTPQETDAMCRLLEEQLDQGAMGLSLGLIYPPGSFCDTQEILALARVVASRDKLLAVHMRNENQGVFDALEEMIGVALATGVRLEISHLKLMGKSQWGRAGELLARIDLARAQGARIHCDQYPYCASNSVLTSCFPKWAMEGGFPKLVERLKDNEQFEKIFSGGLPEMDARAGADRINIGYTGGHFTEIEGMTLVEMAAYMKMPLFNAMREALIRCEGVINCIYHSINRQDMLTIMSRRDVCTASDGSAYDLSHLVGRPHPRSSSTFPRFLRIVREEKLMPIEDAVYKMTALPAVLMGLGGKIGCLKEGYRADITVFNAETVADRATYLDPSLKPVGIERVFVGGVEVLSDGQISDSRPGTFFLI